MNEWTNGWAGEWVVDGEQPEDQKINEVVHCAPPYLCRGSETDVGPTKGATCAPLLYDCADQSQSQNPFVYTPPDKDPAVLSRVRGGVPIVAAASLYQLLCVLL